MTVSEEFRKYLIDVFKGGRPYLYKFDDKVETIKEYYLNNWLCEKLHYEGCKPNTKYYVRLVWIMYHCFCKMPETMELTDELNKKYIHYAHPEEHRNLKITKSRDIDDIYEILVKQYTETYVNEAITCDNFLYKQRDKLLDKDYDDIVEYHYQYDIITYKLVNAGKKILYKLWRFCKGEDFKEVFNQQEVSPYLFEEHKVVEPIPVVNPNSIPVEVPIKCKILQLIEKLKEIDSERDQFIEKLKKFDSERDKRIEKLKKIYSERDKYIVKSKKFDSEKDKRIEMLMEVYSERIMLIEKLMDLSSERDQLVKQIRKHVDEL